MRLFKRKINLFRIFIFILLLVSPVLGVFYGHGNSVISKILDSYVVIWTFPILLLEKYFPSKDSQITHLIYWLVQLAWVFVLASLVEKILIKIRKKLRKRKYTPRKLRYSGYSREE